MNTKTFILYISLIIIIFAILVTYCNKHWKDTINTSPPIEDSKIESLQVVNNNIIIEINNLDSIKNAKIIEVKNLDNDSTLKLFYKLIRN